jgi:hypothetical protein
MEDPRAAALNARPETRRAHTQWIWCERGSELLMQAAPSEGDQEWALRAGEADNAERELALPGTRSECLGDIPGARQAEQADDQIAQGGHDVRPGLLADPAPVLIEGHVADPVRFVLDHPMGASQGEEPGGVGLLWGGAGDPVDHLGAEGGPREIRALPPQAEDLGRIGEREIAGQLRGGPELPGVDPAMPLGGVRVLRGEMRRAGASGCRL